MEGFEILEKLGDGTYSVVYKVKRKEDSGIYALKKVKLKGLKDKEKENALNEVRILASVKSPFVISYKEAFIDEGSESLCIVMEYADQGDLYQKIVQLKKMGCLIEEIDAWKIFIQMTRGLKSLHDLKILHRDLKSANIFLFSDGSAKIGDLNVSKVARKGLGYTQTGTPYYASPEVWEEKAYDSKSDIWSLGCVTYEMLTLNPPFRAKDIEELYRKVIKGQYRKIYDKYSNDMSEIIDYLLKVNPKERPSCDQILKHPIIKKRLEFFQSQSGENEDIDNMDEGVLLRTIRLPKNIIFLSEKLPDKNYEKNKSQPKGIGRNNRKKSTQNSNSSLPNIKILNNIKTPNFKITKTLDDKNNKNQINEKEKEKTQTNNKIIIRKEKSNISISKYNINIIEDKNIQKKESSHISKSPPNKNMKIKCENVYITKNNINSIDTLQLNKKRYYGNNIIYNKRSKIDDIYKYYTPIYLNNKYNIYGMNYNHNRKSIEGTKHEQILPYIYNNNIGGNHSIATNKIITNKRLKPIIPRNKLIKIHP